MIRNEELGTLIRNRMESSCPEEIRNFLEENSVLSGGSLLFHLTDGFKGKSDIPETPEITDFFEKISMLLNYTTKESIGDYDIYTNKTVEESLSYFYNYGYKPSGYFSKLADKSPEEVKMHASSYYLSLIMLDNGHNKLDLIFTEEPAKFVERQFDLDICKLWYDGKYVNYFHEEYLNDLNNRVMRFSFDKEMTINYYKLTTTGLRLLKYRSRGFTFQNSVDNLHEWYDKFLHNGMGYFINHDGPVLQIIPSRINGKSQEIVDIEMFNRERFDKFIEYRRYNPRSNVYLRNESKSSYEYKLLCNFYKQMCLSGKIDLKIEYPLPLQVYEVKYGSMLSHLAQNHPELIGEFIDKCIDKHINISAITIVKTLRHIIILDQREFLKYLEQIRKITSLRDISYNNMLIRLFQSSFQPDIKYSKEVEDNIIYNSHHLGKILSYCFDTIRLSLRLTLPVGIAERICDGHKN